MKHEMRLAAQPFEMLRDGRKTIELRLNDEKRRRLRVGDVIVFRRADDPAAAFEAEVTGLFPFRSFAELYRALPPTACGYTEENAAQASPDDMDLYYTKEQQEKYGALGIRVAVKREPAADADEGETE